MHPLPAAAVLSVSILSLLVQAPQSHAQDNLFSYGGIYQPTLGQPNHVSPFGPVGASTQNALTVVRGTSGQPDRSAVYAQTAAYIELQTAVVQDRAISVWGNAYKTPALTVEAVAALGFQGELNGAAFRASSTVPPVSTDPSRRILLGFSALGQTNAGAGRPSWDVWGGNVVAAWTTGEAPTNVVGLEADVIPLRSAGSLRPGQPGAQNYTAFWAQAAGVRAIANTAFLATTVSGSGWQYGMSIDSDVHAYLAFLRTHVRDPGAKGLYVETAYDGEDGRVLELAAGGREQLRVDGSADDPVRLRVGGALRRVRVDGQGFLRAE